jgi:site-specific recombinase XerD
LIEPIFFSSTIAYQANDDLVFPSFRLKGRKPPRANMLVADHLQPAARKAGITGKVGFHTLRRTLASALVANGNDARLVASGHRNRAGRPTDSWCNRLWVLKKSLRLAG